MHGSDLRSALGRIRTGPIQMPVAWAQLANTDSGQGFDALRFARWNAPVEPVAHGLNRFTERPCDDCCASEPLEGRCEGVDVGHDLMVHDSFSRGQQDVFTGRETAGMPKKSHPAAKEAATPVWDRVSTELERRGKRPSWLVLELKTSAQRIQNWTTRDIPPAAYFEVAAAMGESVDWIVGLKPPKWRSEDAPPPSPGPSRFADRRELSESDWQEFQALMTMIPDAERQELVRKYRALQKQFEDKIRGRSGLRGDSLFDDLSPPETGRKQHGKPK